MQYNPHVIYLLVSYKTELILEVSLRLNRCFVTNQFFIFTHNKEDFETAYIEFEFFSAFLLERLEVIACDLYGLAIHPNIESHFRLNFVFYWLLDYFGGKNWSKLAIFSNCSTWLDLFTIHIASL